MTDAMKRALRATYDRTLCVYRPKDDGTAIQARYLYDLFVPGNSVVSVGAVIEPAEEDGNGGEGAVT